MRTCGATYDAESEAAGNGPEEVYLTPEELPGFCAGALAGAGWGGDSLPTFEFDVPDDDELAGWHEGATGVIHMHPRLLSRWHVLHELAHWLRPLDGHGAQYTGTMVGLVRAVMGERTARGLLEDYRVRGLPVDEGWT